MESQIIILLGAVIAYQQFFWSRQVQKLVDKLMSRNFHEYKAVESPAPPKTQEMRIPLQTPEYEIDSLQGVSI